MDFAKNEFKDYLTFYLMALLIIIIHKDSKLVMFFVLSAMNWVHFMKWDAPFELAWAKPCLAQQVSTITVQRYFSKAGCAVSLGAAAQQTYRNSKSNNHSNNPLKQFKAG